MKCLPAAITGKEPGILRTGSMDPSGFYLEQELTLGCSLVRPSLLKFGGLFVIPACRRRSDAKDTYFSCPAYAHLGNSIGWCL